MKGPYPLLATTVNYVIIIYPVHSIIYLHSFGTNHNSINDYTLTLFWVMALGWYWVAGILFNQEVLCFRVHVLLPVFKMCTNVCKPIIRNPKPFKCIQPKMCKFKDYNKPNICT